MEQKKYASKLLLFGEYAILCGGEGLAIPYPDFYLSWDFTASNQSPCKKHLDLFLQYLQENDFSASLDLLMFSSDLEKGLDIFSNIPIGYGIGSSGAIVAAVYDKYAKHKIADDDTVNLKAFLGLMENYFHQKSSGLDPLVSYLNKPVHVKQDGSCEVLFSLPLLNNISFALTDTGKSRSTNTFVRIFNEHMRQEQYKKQILHIYLPLVSSCIKLYLENDSEQLFPALRSLSAFQLEYFAFAIPEEILRVWENALQSTQELYKLCGAGGGGFMLRFTCPARA